VVLRVNVVRRPAGLRAHAAVAAILTYLTTMI
jgi:hypothetical protein